MIDETSQKPDEGSGSDSPIDPTPALPTRRSLRAAAANSAEQPEPVTPALSLPTVVAGTVSASAPAAPRLSSAVPTSKAATRVEARQSRWKSIRSLLIVAVAVPAIFGTVALPAYAFTEETAAVAPIHDTGAQSLTVPDWTRPDLGRDGYSATTAAELESARAAKAAAEAAAAAAKLAASRPAARSGNSGSSGNSGTYTGSANDPELAAFLVGRSDIWQRSVPGSISSSYGPRGLICNGAGCSNSFHDGVDFSGSCGTPIKAVSAGRVTFTGAAGSYGNRVIVDHGGGVESIYGHVQSGSFKVAPGQLIEAGTVVASIGATGVVSGCHLDLKIRLGGNFTNPVPYMASRGVRL